MGTTLAGYRIEALLGWGGMSTVYRAEDLTLGRRVALKLMSEELSADPAFRERFRAEWRLAASIDHPNVIPIHEAGEAEGQLFIAMRYVEGTDLGALLAQEGALAPERALGLVRQAAAGLDAAHDKGLVHRDVKPSNVLISFDRDGEHAYLADFGLTKPADSEEGARESIRLSGTVQYVAPEQILDASASERSDLYALGALLYQALTGRVPYPRETEAQALYAQVTEPPPQPTALRPELPGAIDAVIATAMAKHPEDRYATGAELADAATAAFPMPRASRRLLAATVAAVALVLAAATVAAVLALSGGDDPVVGHDWRRVPHIEAVFGGTLVTGPEAIAWNESGFVAVGATGSFGDKDSDVAVLTSPDGTTWTRVDDEDLGGPGFQFAESVTAGPAGFTVVGGEVLDPKDPTIRAAIWTSPDATSWTRVPHDDETFGGSSTASILDVVHGGPGLLAVGTREDPEREQMNLDGAVWTSTDGTKWSRVPRDPEVFAPQYNRKSGWIFIKNAAVSDDGTVVAVGVDSDWSDVDRGLAAAWVSADGTSWTRVAHDDAVFGDGSSVMNLYDVTVGGPGFVAVGAETDRVENYVQLVFSEPGSRKARALIVTSEDGRTWSRVPDRQLPDGGEKAMLEAIVTGGPGLVAVGWRRNKPFTGKPRPDVDPVVWTSKDGLSWAEAADPDRVFSQPGGQLISEIASDGRRLVAIGLDGDEKSFNTAIWTSP